jgi:hypothetical protein
MKRAFIPHLAQPPVRYIVAAFACCAIIAGAPSLRAQNQFRLEENQFNSWLYNNGRGNGKLDQDSEVTLNVDAVDRACHLNDAQKEKLRLAASGDYARFLQQVEQLHDELVGKSYDQNEIGKVYEKIQPLSARYQAGMLGDASLFAKVLHSTLTPEQTEEYAAADLERRQARHEAKCKLFVAVFEQSCPLTAKQRDALLQLLLKETRPAKRQSEYDWYVVAFQVSQISEKKLNTILDASQMKVLKTSTRQARGLEAHLKRTGVLPDE